jgi:hypothetical protein
MEDTNNTPKEVLSGEIVEKGEIGTTPAAPLVPSPVMGNEFLNIGITINCEDKDGYLRQLTEFVQKYHMGLNDAVWADIQDELMKVPELLLKKNIIWVSYHIPPGCNLHVVGEWKKGVYYKNIRYYVYTDTIAMRHPQLVNNPDQTPYKQCVEIFFDIFKPTMVSLDDETKGNVTWEFCNNGIWRIEKTTDKNENESVYRGRAWLWNELRVTDIIKARDGTEKYDIWCDGVFYPSQNLRTFIQTIATKNLQNKVYYSKFGPLFNLFVREEIETDRIRIWKSGLGLGFIKEWNLPDKYKFDINPGIQERVVKSFERLMELDVDEAQAREYFRLQYEATEVDYRDVIFAWGIAQWCFFALLPYTRLSPYLVLQAHDPQSGKTSVAIGITTKWWDHLGNDDVGMRLECISPAATISQIKEYLACSPIAICMDESNKMNEEIQSLLKSNATSVSSWMVKNTDSTLRLSQAYKAPTIFAENDLSDAMKDTAYLQRGLILHLKKKFTVNNSEYYKKLMDTIPNGYQGKYIITKTQKLTITDVKSLYDSRPDWPEAPDDRGNTIWKSLQLGKFWCKEWYGVDLNLSDIPKLVAATRMTGFEEIFDTIREQVHAGGYAHHLRQDEKGDYQFIPDRKWIIAPIYNHEYKKKPGYLFDNSNKTDLVGYLKVYKNLNLTLPKLHQILQTRWDVVWDDNGFTHKGRSRRAIWIAKSNVFYDPPKTPTCWPFIIHEINKIGTFHPQFEIEDVMLNCATMEGVTKQEVEEILVRVADEKGYLKKLNGKYILSTQIPENLDKTDPIEE